MLVYLYNTQLFYDTPYKRSQAYSGLLPPPPHIQTYKQHGERGNVGVVRERGRTADDRQGD